MNLTINRIFTYVVVLAAAVVVGAHSLPVRAMASPDQSKSAEKKDAPGAAKKAAEPKKDAKSENKK
jgi:hypothetical protein